jgi:hypothetical protein
MSTFAEVHLPSLAIDEGSAEGTVGAGRAEDTRQRVSGFAYAQRSANDPTISAIPIIQEGAESDRRRRLFRTETPKRVLGLTFKVKWVDSVVEEWTNDGVVPRRPIRSLFI